MQEHERVIPEEELNLSDSGSHKIERTRQLLFEKDLLEMRAELEMKFQYERDYLIQNVTEREIRFEKTMAATKDQVEDLQKQVRSLKDQIDSLKKEKVDLRELAIILSDLSLQLMRSSEKHEE